MAARFALDRQTRAGVSGPKTENNTMLKIVGITLTAAALMGAAAQAAPDMIRTDVQVGYSDLDLSTEGGAQELLVRIEHAAAEACGISPNFYSVHTVAPALAEKEFNTCRANAVDTAMKSLKYPMVQKIYSSADAPYLRLARK
jgi:UrcA family protein